MCVFDIIDLVVMAISEYTLTNHHRRLLHEMSRKFTNLAMEGF